MHADRIHVLERGRIVETGEHTEFLDRKGLYFTMWRQQRCRSGAALSDEKAPRFGSIREGPSI